MSLYIKDHVSFANLDVDFLKCSICTLLFSTSTDKDQSRVPKTLPCVHTFCRSCIVKSVNQLQQDFHCFMCRTPTPLDKTLGVDSLKTNFMVQELVEACNPLTNAIPISNSTSSSSPQNASDSSDTTVFSDINAASSVGSDSSNSDICDLCPEEDSVAAAFRCYECEELLCASCSETHLKSKKGRGHNCVPLVVSTKKKRIVSRKCHVHKSKFIEYVCETCIPHMPCCQMCLIEDHQDKGHKLSSLPKYVARQREQMRIVCDESEQLLQVQKDILSSVCHRITVNQSNIDNCLAQVDHSFDRLTETLAGFRRAWRDEILSHGSNIAGNLSVDKRMIQIHISGADMFVGRATEMLEVLTELEFCEQSSKLIERLKEVKDALVAPLTLTDVDKVANDDGRRDVVVNRLISALSEHMHSCPFILPTKQRLSVAARLLKSPLFTSSFNEDIIIRQRPQSDTFGNTGGVLNNAYGLCIYIPITGVGGRDSDVDVDVDFDSNSTRDGPSIFVCDYGNSRIQVLDPISGAHKRTICGGGRGSFSDQLNYPIGICLGPSINTSSCSGSSNIDEQHLQHPLLYIADAGNNRVQVVNSLTGSLVGTIGGNGEAGNRNDQLSNPQCVCIGPSSNNNPNTATGLGTSLHLYVSDCGNHRIQVFNAETLAYVQTIGNGYGSRLGQLNLPCGICLGPSSNNDDNLLFVVEVLNHRISVFNAATGSFVRTISAGSAGIVGGQLNAPISAYYLPTTKDNTDGGGAGSSNNSDPLLFVGDRSNNRVVVFNAISGFYIRHIDVGHSPRFFLPCQTPGGDFFLYISTSGGYLNIVHSIRGQTR